MDHVDALELIELAALEPDGLERLMAGDTPESAAVAGHLAGCPACVAELARVRRTATLVREAIASLPDPSLRDRTLAYVREVGRDRSTGVPATVADRAAGGPEPVPADREPVPADPAGIPAPPARAARRPGSRSRWVRVAAFAAALVLAAGLGFGAATVAGPAVRSGDELRVLEATTGSILRLESRPDTRRIALVATALGGGAAGSLLYSPSSGELVMVAEGLRPLGPGEEYGCWVEIDGAKTRIGRMYPGGELQAWAGPVDGLDALPATAVFGVSLVPAGATAGDPVLVSSR